MANKSDLLGFYKSGICNLPSQKPQQSYKKCALVVNFGAAGAGSWRPCRLSDGGDGSGEERGRVSQTGSGLVWEGKISAVSCTWILSHFPGPNHPLPLLGLMPER